MRIRATTIVCILVLGIVATLIAASFTASLRVDRAEEATQALAEQLAESTTDELTTAFDTAGRVADINNVQWLTARDYATVWDTFATTLGDESTATLVVAIPPGDLETFAAAERAVSGEFELSFVNRNPPPTGHLVSARSVTDRAQTGIDLSSIPGTGASFWALAPNQTVLLDADVRRPGQTGNEQIQVFTRHEVQGPTGATRDAWTAVQVDTRAIFGELVETMEASQGASFSTDINSRPSTFGIDAAAAVASASAVAIGSDVDVTIEVWSDGLTTSGLTAATVRWIGFATTALAVLAALLGFAISALLRRLGESDRDARRDQLTNLKNRRWMVERFEELDGRPAALLFCDIDRFKVVNDSADHSVGDKLLVSVARRMEAALGQQSDVIRFGGDEFIVLSEPPAGQQPAAHGEAIAARLSAAMRQPFTIADGKVRVTLSTGIAARNSDELTTGTELIRRADVAAGFCKQNGRNQYAVYDRELRDAERDTLALESDLQVALDNADLVLHYQPIVDAAGGVISFECLVRWNRQGTLIPPNRFLPIVADLGRMVDLGEIVLRAAVAQLAQWIKEGTHHQLLSMHVNVDPSQLADPELPNLIRTLLHEHDVAPSRLILELTEGEWIDNVSSGGLVLDQLAHLGVGLAIDDFGAGYSSMARILEVESLVEIKIDRSIVCRATEPRQKAFLVGLREIADQLGVVLIAEGIETVAEHLAIQGVGISRFQGYLFGHPQPARALVQHEQSPLTDMASPDTVPDDLAELSPRTTTERAEAPGL